MVREAVEAGSTTGVDDFPKTGPQHPPIKDLVALGESGEREFKSTFQWDVRQEKLNKELRHATLKSMAAFLNSHGGTLFLGIDDDGAVYGLEDDFKIANNSRDRFEQVLVSTINEHIGPVYAPYYSVRFEKLEGKAICVIEVERSSEPVFMKSSKGKEFFARAGNTTRPLDVEETHRYIKLHWPH